MTWILAAPALLASVALILAPGVVAAAPLRLGLVARAALGGLLSVVCFGVAGVAFGAASLPFAFWQPFVPALVAAAVLWALTRRPTRVPVPVEASRWRWVVLAWAASGVVVAIVAFAAVGSPEQVSQTYDNVFHMSAVAAILDGRDASSLTLRTLIETDRAYGFYPAAWHSLVAAVAQVSGSSAVVAANATWIGVAAAVWLPGAVWLAQVLLRRAEPSTVALVAFPLAAAFGAMPFSLLSWGTLYPTFLATAVLPAALAVPLLAGRALLETAGVRRWRASLLGAAAVATAIAAVAFAQPRVLATWALLLAPAVVAAGLRLARSAWRAGGTARRAATWSLVGGAVVLVLAAAAAFAYLVVVLDLFERPLEDRLGGPQAAATQSVATGVLQALGQAWPTGVGATAAWPSVLLAVAVLGGVVAAARHRGIRWIVVSYTAVVVLYALAAGSDDVFSKLATALWYKDRYRLSSAVPVLGVTLSTLGILALGGLLAARRGWGERTARRVPVAAAWLTALSSAAVLMITGATSSIGTVFRMPAAAATSEVVSQAQIGLMSRLGEHVPAGERVLGDPWDGSAWTQLYGGREPVFPHVNGQWDAARLTLAYGLDAVETDPAVCAALDTLRVRFVLYSPHEFGGGDPAGNHFPAVHRAVEAGLFTEVASDGAGTVLYRIDECG